VFLPPADTVNSERAPAYAFEPKHALAQLAATGCLSNTFYADDARQLQAVQELAKQVDAGFLARTAVYARTRGAMKDMPALLLAVLATRDVARLKAAFPRVVDNGRMLRNFVQIVRSGAVGRKSLGSAPKHLVQAWLNTASERKLIDASVGADPSLADVVRMVHPKPTDPSRAAFFGWLLGKPYAFDALPASLQAFELYKRDRSRPLPEVPFQMLTALGLGPAEWAAVARHGGWQMVRMNLNTFLRHGVFERQGMAECVAAKLRDPAAIRGARVLPYQLMVAYASASPQLPPVVREALQDALEVALGNVAAYPGRVAVCPDVSGSIRSAVTGHRKGATSVVRCVDVAALVAAAIVRANRDAIVLPFEQGVVPLALNPRDSVLTNAAKLAAVGGGGTNCSAPLEELLRSGAQVDLVVLVSDNESWVDARRFGPTATMHAWARVRARNPAAKLVCIDLQPNRTTQALERPDVLNVGGFSDAVFDVVARFASGGPGAGHWVEEIERTEV
jgi:60 kDa SS-A/Ro ribonucleoprotein